MLWSCSTACVIQYSCPLIPRPKTPQPTHASTRTPAHPPSSQAQRMDALFEASFSPLASSGKVLSKCGRCSRYMKLIASRPSRLYCPTCEEVYNMPQVRTGQQGLAMGLVCCRGICLPKILGWARHWRC